MPSTPRQVLRPQLQRSQLIQVFRPLESELIQQLAQRPPLALAFLRPAIERLKRAPLAKFQNHFCSRHPVSALAMYQMSHYVKRVPTISTFIAHRPRLRQITQQRIQRRRSASQQGYRVLQVLFHVSILKTIPQARVARVAILSRPLKPVQRYPCDIKTRSDWDAATVNLTLVLLLPPTPWLDSKLGMVTHSILPGGASLAAAGFRPCGLRPPLQSGGFRRCGILETR